MKRVYFIVSFLFVVTAQVCAGDGTPPDQKDIKKHSTIARENKPTTPATIQSMFLFPLKSDAIIAIRNTTVRNAAIGAGMLGAILSGRFAGRLLLGPHLALFGGVNIGGKSANVGINF